MATQDSLGGANPQDVDNFRSFVGVFVPTEEIVDRLKVRERVSADLAKSDPYSGTTMTSKKP